MSGSINLLPTSQVNYNIYMVLLSTFISTVYACTLKTPRPPPEAGVCPVIHISSSLYFLLHSQPEKTGRHVLPAAADSWRVTQREQIPLWVTEGREGNGFSMLSAVNRTQVVHSSLSEYVCVVGAKPESAGLGFGVLRGLPHRISRETSVWVVSKFRLQNVRGICSDVRFRGDSDVIQNSLPSPCFQYPFVLVHY